MEKRLLIKEEGAIGTLFFFENFKTLNILCFCLGFWQFCGDEREDSFFVCAFREHTRAGVPSPSVDDDGGGEEEGEEDGWADAESDV